ncbi:MAG TPA: NAD+ synthase [Desulfarculaceae bacterium]|nr:NAD+ synthase [Desulfarculaceae bacterium]
MKITLAQLNPTVGDLDGNLEKLNRQLNKITKDDPDLVILPELFLTGYPPRDLLDHDSFIKRCDAALTRLQDISSNYPETAILIGTVTRCQSKHGKKLHNSAILIENGRILFQQDKTLLPAYDVFDENRYFEPATEIRVYPFRGELLGISICEDAWNEAEAKLPHLYAQNPLPQLGRAGATLLINLSASPYYLGKEQLRFATLSRQSKQLGLPLIMVNQVGGNDELIFDGCSLILNNRGEKIAQAPQFAEKIISIDSDRLTQSASLSPSPAVPAPPDSMSQLEGALVLGIKDYFAKCGFSEAVIGLSGGIDSALTCALAVKALGPNKVWGITMPSPYSSGGSVDDSKILANNLGIRFDIIPISNLYQSYLDALKPIFGDLPMGLAEENVQARIRGNLLMSIANKFNRLLLTTGNKSELAVGYCTLYGDMSGGLAPISDLPKGLVYKLSRHCNRNGIIIPETTLTKEPSAELRPDQRDQDSLPPYDLLDRILELYIDEGVDAETIISREGLPAETVSEIITAVKRNEYKRRQAPPGLKVTSKAFGCGRRMPVAAHY